MSTLGQSDPARHSESYSIPFPSPSSTRSLALRGGVSDPSRLPVRSSSGPRTFTASADQHPGEDSSIPLAGPRGLVSEDSAPKQYPGKDGQHLNSGSSPWAQKLDRVRRLLPRLFQRIKKALHVAGSSKTQAAPEPVQPARGHNPPAQPRIIDATTTRINPEELQPASASDEDVLDNSHQTEDLMAKISEEVPTGVSAMGQRPPESGPDLSTTVPVVDSIATAENDPADSPAQRSPSGKPRRRSIYDVEAVVIDDAGDRIHLETSDARLPKRPQRTDSGQEDSPKIKGVIAGFLGDSRGRFDNTVRRISSSSAMSFMSPRALARRRSRTLSQWSTHSISVSSSLILDRIMIPPEDGMVEDVYRFLQEGVDVHAVTSQGETALHLAVRRGYCALCGVLLWSGADPRTKTKHGLDPYNYARQAERTADNETLRSRIMKCRQHVKYGVPGGADTLRHPLSSKFSLSQSILTALEDLRQVCDDLDPDEVRSQRRRKDFETRAKATGPQPVNDSSDAVEPVNEKGSRAGTPMMTDGDADRESEQEQGRSGSVIVTRDDDAFEDPTSAAHGTVDSSSTIQAELTTLTEPTELASPTLEEPSLPTQTIRHYEDLSPPGTNDIQEQNTQDSVPSAADQMAQEYRESIEVGPNSPNWMAAEPETSTLQESSDPETSTLRESADPRPSWQDSVDTNRGGSAPTSSEIPSTPPHQRQSLSTEAEDTLADHSERDVSYAPPVNVFTTITSPGPVSRKRIPDLERPASSAAGPIPRRRVPDVERPASSAAALDLNALANYAFQTSWYLNTDDASRPSNAARTPATPHHDAPKASVVPTQTELRLPEPQTISEKLHIKLLVDASQGSTAWLSCRHNWPRNYGNSLCMEGCLPLKAGVDDHVSVFPA